MTDITDQLPEDDQDVELKSKTQLKNEMHELQQLGQKLVDLGQAALAKVPMDTELAEAVKLARRINRKKDGFRRQLQFIGKLMRNRDTTPIRQALDLIENRHQQATVKLHRLERMRDDIVAKGDSAIEAALQENPQLERQKLRQLALQAQREASHNKPPKASREIFQYLKEMLVD
ncbi:ribosome biogenesis factor YjgA [Aliiglaciecola sp. CAU 1673]|uniref:ribosome biogenesis factor YjgA n=1 Tax=Aliiglaciecola sp. CAU 1673 TaxID=3032595 RepID=UPI0023DC31A9|nr:ribosome biogenesis factor YjgA [Aliiglaciecola sp. CAU 1673]MDF2179120.1 ribosome biogenesis factor YjgA [Aliiglaciecola sp. CAU 1673]